jgi:glycosyltransferase involved in cell wall biosynthesis
VIWLVTPAHGREALTRIVLRQRVRMIQDLARDNRVKAACVVIACDPNLDTARDLGLDAIHQTNDQLGRRFNDGIEYALEHGATYIVPAGSDCWIHPDYLTRLHPNGPIRSSRAATIVREDGSAFAHVDVNYHGGLGSRIYPRRILQPMPRPADEHRRRGIDTSILTNLEHHHGRLTFQYDGAPLDLVDFKSTVTQLNTYGEVKRAFATEEHPDPWPILRAAYPRDLVNDMENLYAQLHNQNAPTRRQPAPV